MIAITASGNHKSNVFDLDVIRQVKSDGGVLNTTEVLGGGWDLQVDSARDTVGVLGMFDL